MAQTYTNLSSKQQRVRTAHISYHLAQLDENSSDSLPPPLSSTVAEDRVSHYEWANLIPKVEMDIEYLAGTMPNAIRSTEKALAVSDR